MRPAAMSDEKKYLYHVVAICNCYYAVNIGFCLQTLYKATAGQPPLAVGHCLEERMHFAVPGVV